MHSERENRARALVTEELRKRSSEIEKAEDAEARAESASGDQRQRLLHAARLHRRAAAVHEQAARLHQLHADHEMESDESEDDD